MDSGTLILHIARLVFGGITAFLAIYLWSQTRDTPWMLVILGIIIRYLEITYSTLTFFGIMDENGLLFSSVPLARFLLENLPYLFFSAAILIMIRRQRFH